MEKKKRWIMPAFGNWEHSYRMPTTTATTQCYGSGSQAVLNSTRDQFKLPVAVPSGGVHCCRKARKANGVRMEKHCSNEQEQRRHRKVFDAATTGPPRRLRAPMAVDEDLYKIPPELFTQTPKRKRVLKKLLSGCMSLNCVC